MKKTTKNKSLEELKNEWPNFILWLYLLSPLVIILFENYQYTGIDLLTIYNLGISIFWLLLIRFIPFDQFKIHLLLFPFYIASTIDLFLVLNFHARFASAYMYIGLTNYKEANNFLPTYWRSIGFILLVFIICYITGLIGLYRKKFNKSSYIFITALGLLIAGYGFYFYKTVEIHSFGKSALMDLIAKDQSIPVGYLSQIALTSDLYFQSENFIKLRQEDKVKVTDVSNTSNIQTVVFVIGESARRQNWSLYGYDKDTTPYLDKETGVFKFNRMCTTAPYTAVAVPSMLSLQPIWKWDSIASTKSIVSVLRAAGYDTYWLDTQEVDSFGGIIPQIAAEAQYQQYFPRSFDGALIPEYEKILKNKNNKKQAIFIHIKGSHFEYSRRYPKNFDEFKPITHNRKDTITAHYDNTVLYTDWLLNTIIDQLKNTKKPAILFYSSDHGENLMDDDQKLLGHGIGNKYDLQVSSFIWASNNISKDQTIKLLRLKSRENEKISISSLPHTLLDILGIMTNNYNKTDDLLSDEFTPSKCPYKLGTKYVAAFDFHAH